MNKRILVVAAHPDDEVLGCGGTMARHVTEGDDVHVIFMSDGVNSRVNSDEYQLKRRKDAAKKAHGILGVSSTQYLSFPDNMMDSVPLLNIVQALEEAASSIDPEVVYTHFRGDLNIDHQLTYRAVMTAFRPVPDQSVKKILCFEVLSSTEWSFIGQQRFNPNYFIDTSLYINLKRSALDEYVEEMRNTPHSRSYEHVRAISSHRGLSVGFCHAEAFEVARVIE